MFFISIWFRVKIRIIHNKEYMRCTSWTPFQGLSSWLDRFQEHQQECVRPSPSGSCSGWNAHGQSDCLFLSFFIQQTCILIANGNTLFSGHLAYLLLWIERYPCIVVTTLSLVGGKFNLTDSICCTVNPTASAFAHIHQEHHLCHRLIAWMWRQVYKAVYII